MNFSFSVTSKRMIVVTVFLIVNSLLVEGTAVFYELENAEQYFESFLVEHNKQYASELEKAFRLQVFTENLIKLNRLNEKSPGAVYGINQFSDLTVEEFVKYHTGLSENLGASSCSVTINQVNSSIAAPDSFDWRDQNVVTRVKDQLRCGSCWAFAATGNIESLNAIKNKELVELSEQQLVDCDDESSGCIGTSNLANPLYYLIDYGGSILEKDYPYEGKDGTCRHDENKVKVKIAGCRNIDLAKDEEKLKNILHQYGPAIIAVAAEGMQGYQAGIIHGEDCDAGPINHAVLLVGYGTENGVPYWIIKNSWSPKWGEEGYVRVERGVNCLRITNVPPIQAIIG